MVAEWILSITELRDFLLVVLFLAFDTQVVYLDVYTVAHLKEFNNVLSRVTNCNFHTVCGVSKGDHIVCDIGQIEVKTFNPQALLLFGHQRSETNERVHRWRCWVLLIIVEDDDAWATGVVVVPDRPVIQLAQDLSLVCLLEQILPDEDLFALAVDDSNGLLGVGAVLIILGSFEILLNFCKLSVQFLKSLLCPFISQWCRCFHVHHWSIIFLHILGWSFWRLYELDHLVLVKVLNDLLSLALVQYQGVLSVL